jgi:predicted PurR-regulated permease PerM
MDAPRRSGWLVATLSLLAALLANASNFFLAGVAAGPIAFVLALYAIWRSRGWPRIVSLVAALLAIAAFVISLAAIYGLSHGCGDAPNC